jgi:hypothetical protein
LEEIKEWGIVGNHRRRIILQNAKERREARLIPGSARVFDIRGGFG